MAKIEKITKQTSNPYLNMYLAEGVNKAGKPLHYLVASRAPRIEDLKINTKNLKPDGVIIYSLYGESHDRVVLVRQYRVSIDGYIYELPAGLVDAGETYQQAAVRELHEETGLIFTPAEADPGFEKPAFTTIGMTDECCATCFGYASGEVSRAFMEESEEIEIVLADRKEALRILREERVATVCAYQLMHFISDPEPFAFLKLSQELME